MTPCQKIKREIMLLILEDFKLGRYLSEEDQKFRVLIESGITAETVDKQYTELIELNLHWDYESEFRQGTVETKLSCPYSRCYEAKAVARKLSDGWVGWTYWYGGGKHGNPEQVEWMEDAYNLEVTETEKTVIVQEFKKV